MNALKRINYHMFHVEQFDFTHPFHVEQKHAKTLLNSGIFSWFWRRINNF